MKLKFFVFSLLLFFSACSRVWSAPPDPQYVFVRKNPMSCNPSDCRYLWNMDQPDKINLDAINDIYNKVGTHGNDQRRLGIGVQLFYNLYPMENLKASLDKLLDYAQVHNVPLYFALGGFQWVDNAPEIWNWWDSSSPGYDNANRHNVEWTCWDPSCAIKRSWRNWGSEMEVKPHPNLASSEFINHNKQRLQELVPLISDWYQQLPEEKKWLFGGMSLGVEVDVGGNYYYYPNGENTGSGIADSIQLGYAAVKTAGIRDSGGPPTAQELNQVVQSYYTQLNQVALDLGIPRNKLFSHTSADDFLANSIPDYIYRPDSRSGFNDYSNPGWSMYGGVTRNPQDYNSLDFDLNSINNSEWGSPEWLPLADDYYQWVDALRSSLAYRNNRFVNVANWEEIRDKGYILNALNKVLQEEPSCWVTSPQIEAVTVNNDQVSFSWLPGDNNQTVYLNVSNQRKFKYTGQFETINIVNENVTEVTSYQKSGLAEGQYYWQLIADGCGGQRRRINGSFTIGKTVTCPSCSSGLSKNKGNADCNNSIDLLDFAGWLEVFKAGGTEEQKAAVDFNCQESDTQHTVNLADFQVWLENYIF